MVIANMNKPKLSYEFLMSENQRFAAVYEASQIMRLLSDSVMNNPIYRYRMLDFIQTISNYFQKILLLRCSVTDNPLFSQIAIEHLKEEFCHNEILMKERNQRPIVWDPILEGCCSWFAWKMLTSNDEEKYFLIHCVLESSGKIFFQKAYEVLKKYGPASFFQVHSEEDEKHESMGRALLQGLSVREYSRLLELQQQGWSMITTACDRVAEKTYQQVEFHKPRTGTDG